jgi:hypothetical protein
LSLHRHCEERSDAAIQSFFEGQGLDCFVAMTGDGAAIVHVMVLRSIENNIAACIAHHTRRKPTANNLMEIYGYAEEGNRRS